MFMTMTTDNGQISSEMLTWAHVSGEIKRGHISQLKPNFVSLSPFSNLKHSNPIVTNPLNVFHLYMIECTCWSMIGVVVVVFEQPWFSKYIRMFAQWHFTAITCISRGSWRKLEEMLTKAVTCMMGMIVYFVTHKLRQEMMPESFIITYHGQQFLPWGWHDRHDIKYAQS